MTQEYKDIWAKTREIYNAEHMGEGREVYAEIMRDTFGIDMAVMQKDYKAAQQEIEDAWASIGARFGDSTKAEESKELVITKDRAERRGNVVFAAMQYMQYGYVAISELVSDVESYIGAIRK